MEFAKLFDTKEVAAYRWGLWAAAYIIGGGCSDDAFTDFRASLVCRGKDIYENALSNPDSLSSIDLRDSKEDLFYEGYQYLAAEIYEEKTWKALPDTEVRTPRHPTGKEWDEDSREDLVKICPELMKRYG